MSHGARLVDCHSRLHHPRGEFVQNVATVLLTGPGTNVSVICVVGLLP